MTKWSRHAYCTKASSLKNDLSDSKTFANQVTQPNSTGYDVSAKATVVKLHPMHITQSLDDLSFDERDISAEFVIVRPEPGPERISIAI